MRQFSKMDKVNFIDWAKPKEREIAILYGSLVDLDRIDFLNDSLRKFDDRQSYLYHTKSYQKQ